MGEERFDCRLTTELLAKLEFLAITLGMTKSGVIKALIERAHKKLED